MGTTTALLLQGEGHPYDGGLWNIRSGWRLVEGDKCAWVRFLGSDWETAQGVFLALPAQILEDGLRLCAGQSWEGVPPVAEGIPDDVLGILRETRLVVALLDGSSLRAADCRTRLSRWRLDAEVLAGIPELPEFLQKRG